MNLYNFHSKPESLIHHDVAMQTIPALFAPDWLLGIFPEDMSSAQMAAVSKNPSVAVRYAKTILKGRWPKAEKYIMEDPHAARLYSKLVLRERWPEAEPYIMKDADAAYDYTFEFMRFTGWPEAEPYIMKDPLRAFWYASSILHKRWPEAEPFIKKDNFYWAKYKEEFGI